MATITDPKESAMSCIPSAPRNEKFRAEAADRFVSKATGKRHALATEWLDLSATLDARGSHILADKAIVNAMMIACGSVTLKSLPISIGQAWA
jgi:hypothetical protein